jgi:hypothetical protein
VAVEACTGAADSGSGGMRPSGQTQEPVALLTYDGEYGRVWNLHNDEEITAARVYRCRMSRTRSDMPCGRKTLTPPPLLDRCRFDRLARRQWPLRVQPAHHGAQRYNFGVTVAIR